MINRTETTRDYQCKLQHTVQNPYLVVSSRGLQRHPASRVRSVLSLDWFPVERLMESPVLHVCVSVFPFKRGDLGVRMTMKTRTLEDRNLS